MRTKLLALVGAASLVLIAAACGDDDDDSAAVENVADAKSDSSDKSDSDGDVAAEDGEEAEVASGDAVDARAGEVIGITEGSYVSSPNDQTNIPVTGEITRLERSGDLVEVSFRLTNDHDSVEFDPYCNFCDRSDVAEYDVSGVKLVDGDGDGDGGRIYLPPLDSEEKCLCTSNVNDITLQPGESASLSATFAGVPSDVETAAVQIPGMASVDGLSISG